METEQNKNPQPPDENRLSPEQEQTLAEGEITNNDGSVVETLDTVFHGKPGWFQGENPTGSDRAKYYEQRSEGKTESEQELEELKRQQENNKT